jgi:hypothetical protein
MATPLCVLVVTGVVLVKPNATETVLVVTVRAST